MKNLLTALLLTISFGLFAQTEGLSENIDQWSTHTAENYALSYPENWNLDVSGQMGTTFLLLTEHSSKEDEFKENVNFMVQDISGYNLDLDSYSEISMNQIADMIENSKVLESGKIKASGYDAFRIVYTGTDMDFNFIFTQYYWVENDTAYTLTLTIEEDKFEKYIEVGEEILKRFQLTF